MHHCAVRSGRYSRQSVAEVQVDVIFPLDHELQAAFGELETDYYTSRAAPLAEIYESLRTYGQESMGLSRCVFAVL